MEMKDVLIPESTYIHGNEVDQYIYIQVPLDLIVAECFANLSGEAKILYGMLLNRTGLSVRNGWEDENGRVYINYTIEDVMKDMHVKHCMASKLFSELTKIYQIGEENGKPVWFGLIEKERVINKPSRIYVHKVSEVKRILETFGQDVEETSGQVDQNFDENPSESPETQVIYSDRRRSSTGLDDGHLQEQTTVIYTDRRRSSTVEDENKNNNINNNMSEQEIENTIVSFPFCAKQDAEDAVGKEKKGKDVIGELDSFMQRIREQIEYDVLIQCCNYDQKAKLDDLLDVMAEAYVVMGDVYLKGSRIPHELICRRIDSYDFSMMQYVLTCLQNNRSDVKNAFKYLLAVLYYAPLTMENHISLEVQHDLGDAAPRCEDDDDG